MDDTVKFAYLIDGRVAATSIFTKFFNMYEELTLIFGFNGNKLDPLTVTKYCEDEKDEENITRIVLEYGTLIERSGNVSTYSLTYTRELKPFTNNGTVIELDFGSSMSRIYLDEKLYTKGQVVEYMMRYKSKGGVKPFIYHSDIDEFHIFGIKKPGKTVFLNIGLKRNNIIDAMTIL